MIAFTVYVDVRFCEYFLFTCLRSCARIGANYVSYVKPICNISTYVQRSRPRKRSCASQFPDPRDCAPIGRWLRQLTSGRSVDMLISANVYILLLVLALCWVLAQAEGQLIDAPTLGGTINVMCYCRSHLKLVYSREQLLGISIANVLRARKQIPTLPPVVEAAARQACIYRHQGSRRRHRGGVGCHYTIPVVVDGMTPPIMKSICGRCGVNTSNLVPPTQVCWV